MGATAFNSASFFHESDLLPSRVRLRERLSKKRPKFRWRGRVWSCPCCCDYWRKPDSSSSQWKALLSMPYSRKFPDEEPWECWSSTCGSKSSRRGVQFGHTESD